MKEDSLTDWMQAIGTVGALFLTAAIALAGYFSELRRRSKSTRSAVLLAELVGYHADTAVNRLVQQLVVGPDGSQGLTPLICRLELDSPVWLELLSLMEQVTPVDLPDIETARSYVHLRGQIRQVHKIVSGISGLWSSGKDLYVGPVDLRKFQILFARERGVLVEQSVRAAHPFWPRWAINMRLKKLKKSIAEYEVLLSED